MEFSKAKIGRFIFILGIFLIPISFLFKRYFNLSDNEYFSMLIVGLILELIGFFLLKKKSAN
ncbi:hypothetical protein SAMN05443292_1424 [Halpernia frigidisoli]|uniref:Uncharacterized protein n=1 Tax=Halpernia frigidisoli TaxID=1125876 RepID=A0A1I3FJR0_9FLAO|nr:hypothetical protein SAMN05443292_1424 [Halpernia frigidisoli]